MKDSEQCPHDDDPSVKLQYVERDGNLYLRCPTCGDEAFLRKLEELKEAPKRYHKDAVYFEQQAEDLKVKLAAVVGVLTALHATPNASSEFWEIVNTLGKTLSSLLEPKSKAREPYAGEVDRHYLENHNKSLQAENERIKLSCKVVDLERTIEGHRHALKSLQAEIGELEGKIIDLVGKLEKDPAFECEVCEGEYSVDEGAVCPKCYLGEETARRYKSLQAENERVTKILNEGTAKIIRDTVDGLNYLKEQGIWPEWVRQNKEKLKAALEAKK